MASDLDLRSFKSWDAGDVLSEPLSSESWALGLQINKSLMMMTLIRALSHQGLHSLIRVSLLSCNILQNFKSLETGDVQQNFWSSGFSGTWFFRIDVNSCRLLSCRVLSCHELQNFKPLETGDVHSELLVFRFLWRLVLQSLQVLNAGDVQLNFWSSIFFKHLIRGTIFRGWDLFFRTSCPESSDCFFGKSSEHADADDLLIRNKSSEALSIVFGLRLQ